MMKQPSSAKAPALVMKDRKWTGYAYVDFDALQRDADLTLWV
jgi:hypothetical protein